MKSLLPRAYSRYRIDSEIKPHLTAQYRSIQLSTVDSSIVLHTQGGHSLTRRSKKGRIPNAT